MSFEGITELAGRIQRLSATVQPVVQAAADAKIAEIHNSKTLHGAAWSAALSESIDEALQAACTEALE